MYQKELLPEKERPEGKDLRVEEWNNIGKQRSERGREKNWYVYLYIERVLELEKQVKKSGEWSKDTDSQRVWEELGERDWKRYREYNRIRK